MSLQTRLNALVTAIGADIKALNNKLLDSGQQTSGIFTQTSPHTIVSQGYRKWGKLVQAHVIFTLGAAIAVPASGDVGNTDIATAATAFIPLGLAFMGSAGTGQLIHGQITATGIVQVTSAPPGATLASGTQLQLAGLWLAP